MPEAFAAICEADYRVLGKRPYDVQILAAAALHGGYLAEMNTGEGKTLSATMPLYLNALTGKSCMLVTTNEYLASRDGAEMGEVYNFMGLSCSYPDADDTKKQDDDEKRQFYSADIIYTTNGTLGFDFLFDNLVKKKEDRFLCDFHYVIIDEADSVLLDSAIMPLVISGVPRVQSNLYDVCDFFVTTLVEDIDYIEEDKAVWLTPKGVKFAESFFGISNFYGKENFEINRHVTLSLRAHKLLKNKKDYVVTDKKEVELFDGATGRLMHGVKLRGGQHQAIEAKGSYFFYEQLLADNKENTNLSADLRNVAKLLKESGSYTGALDLNYREFARIYEFVNNVGDRHNHNCYLVIVTMNTLPEQLADIEEIEKALDCMEQSIRSKIRKVDVCTRYSSMQYLIILFEPQENQIPNVMERIFMHYYELCDRENFKPQYEYIKMTEVK